MDQAGSKLLRGLLEVFLLESLEREPKHGYAILKELADSFGVEPNRNRLYPLLGKFVRDGWVREVTDANAGRTIYSLTDEGRAQLVAYRRLPRGFRQTLGRVWGGELRPASLDEDAPEPLAADAASRAVPVHVLDPPAAPRAPAPSPMQAPPAPRVPDRPAAPAAAPVAAPHAHPAAALPYPCPDASLTLRKDPRSGDLRMELTGCPMGAYEYCPQCPVFKGVEGLRRLTFSL
jgi:PadR family transcriptional regulator PadR